MSDKRLKDLESENSALRARLLTAENQIAYLQKPGTRWIPVSESVPDDDRQVLVWTKVFNLVSFELANYVNDAWWESNGPRLHNVTAWRELPDSYSPDKVK